MVRRSNDPINKGAITFDAPTWNRLRNCCRALGTSYVEFVQQAVRHALDECEADMRGSN